MRFLAKQIRRRPLALILILSAVEIYALYQGVDGTSLAAYFTCIGFGVGLSIGKKDNVI